MTWSAMGLARIARHVIECYFAQDTRVGFNWVLMTWREQSARPCLDSRGGQHKQPCQIAPRVPHAQILQGVLHRGPIGPFGTSFYARSADALSVTMYGQSPWRPLSRAKR